MAEAKNSVFRKIFLITVSLTMLSVSASHFSNVRCLMLHIKENLSF